MYTSPGEISLGLAYYLSYVILIQLLPGPPLCHIGLNLTAAGRLNVWIDGSSFGASSACGYVIFNGVPVLSESTPIWGHSQIKIVVMDPNSTDIANTVQVVVGGVPSNILTFLKPVPDFLASSQPRSYVGMKTTGGEPFTVSNELCLHLFHSVPSTIGLLTSDRYTV